MTDSTSPISRVVPIPDAFMFFEDPERYTGEFAVSLVDLLEKLGKVPLKSIEFHFQRRDFERWLGLVLGDLELASRVSHIDRSLRGEKLRTALQRAIKKRLDESREKAQTV